MRVLGWRPVMLITLCLAGCGAEREVVCEQLAPGVFRVAASRSNCYLLVSDTVVLIDTGMRGDGAAVLCAIRSLGRAPQDVSHILITHAHIDHTGSLAMLQRATGATVVAPAAEVDYIAGRRKTSSMGRTGLGGRLFQGMLYVMETWISPYEPAAVDLPCRGGELLACAGGIQVVATPGHSIGSISFYAPRSRCVFTGDALSGVADPGLPQQMGCADYAQALRSVGLLASLDVDVCCFGHGAPLKADAARVLQRLAQAATRNP